MTDSALLSATCRLLEDAGLSANEVSLQSLSGGRNNRVYQVTTQSGCYLLKQFFRHEGDTRNRFESEHDFAQHAWKASVRSIPEPLASDADNALLLSAFIDGQRLTADQLDAPCIDQAIAFCSALNQGPCSAIKDAAEACFSIDDHIACIERRVLRLEKVTDPDARTLIDQRLAPLWQKAKGQALDECKQLGIATNALLTDQERVLSPSDFGFHNALRMDTGKVYFFDFEYAGVDDPAKLCCDFFCQPDVPVDMRHSEAFFQAIGALTPAPDETVQRSRLLLPLYIIKWGTILLNDFLPLGQARRSFSLGQEEEHTRRKNQLERANQMLDRIS